MANPYLLISLTLAVLAGCVSTPPHGASVALASPAASQSARTASQRTVTGSNLPAKIDPRTGQPITSYPLQSVSQKEIETTGQTNVADALRMLLPSVH